MCFTSDADYFSVLYLSLKENTMEILLSRKEILLFS